MLRKKLDPQRQKPTSEYTRSELNNIAQGIIDTLSVSINSTGLHRERGLIDIRIQDISLTMIDLFAADLNYPQNAMMMAGIATHDALLLTLQNKGTVTGSLQTVETLNHLFWHTQYVDPH